MRLRISFLVMFFLLASFIFPREIVKTLSLSARGIDELDIDCGAGSLEVYGKEGLKEIKVEAEIVVRGRDVEKFFKRNVELYLRKRGNKAVLVSKISMFRSIFSVRSPVINLTVEVPKNMDLFVDDSSGSMDIENIGGNLEIEDGSGSIEVEDIEGNLKIDDGSGGIDVREISGDVSIKDGSGSLYVRNVGGNVTVRDGSGSINIYDIEKDVNIIRAGSGSVNIRDVRGSINR